MWVDWIDLARASHQLLAVVNMVMKRRVLLERG
jgi:hypothetical protein